MEFRANLRQPLSDFYDSLPVLLYYQHLYAYFMKRKIMTIKKPHRLLTLAALLAALPAAAAQDSVIDLGTL